MTRPFQRTHETLDRLDREDATRKRRQSKGHSVQGTLLIIEETESGNVALVTIETDHFKTWAVRGPDHFGREMYWTQPDEETAREFYVRLVAHLNKEARV
jgi:hypothetical protein